MSSPDNVDAHGLLAEIYGSRGQHAHAVEQLRQLVSLRPRDAALLRRLGDSHFASGDAVSAADSFRQAIAIEPMRPRAHNNLGRALMQLAQPEAAVECYRRAVALDPDYATAHNNLGMALVERQQVEEALACYDRAIALNSKFAEAHCNRANALQRAGRLTEAIACYERALAIEPLNTTVRFNYATALLRLRRVTSALTQFEQTLRLKPDFADASTGQGNALRELRRFDAALASYDRAVTLQPEDANALGNRITILMDLERFDEAIEACDRLLALQPDFPAALLYRGLSLNFLGRLRYEEAAKSFLRLWEKDPNQPYALGYLLHAYAMSHDWSRDGLNAEAVRVAAQGKAASSPFAFLGVTDDAQMQLKNAQACIQLTHPPAVTPIWKGQRWRNKKIRVAYLSSDLREHALSYLMVGVFEKHDRERFEIYGVSFRPPEGGHFGLRSASSFDLFLDISRQSDEEVARLLVDMQIDIAVDLMGFTRGHRINIFSQRAAPLQVSYLGYPGTTGAPYIDYIVADDYVIPPQSREHYSESIAYLPDCFQGNDDRREIGAHRPTRSEVGLPEDAVVLCSFNNAYKIGPRMFDAWCRLLNARRECVLWLIGESEAARANLLREASSRGIDPQRLIFAERLAYGDHLARMSLADLFLDTLPFNAGTTASDALWAGLPVLTCSGDAFAARMAGSLLHTIGLPELVTHSLAEYERVALRLIDDRAGLAALCARLAVNRAEGPVFATERFCRNLESAYQVMYERSARGEPPETFHVAEQSVLKERR